MDISNINISVHYQGILLTGSGILDSRNSIPTYFESTPASVDTNLIGFGNEETVNFCLTATEVIDDLKISLIPLADPNPGFNTTYRLVYENTGTTQMSGTVNFTFDALRQTFVSATPVATGLVGNEVSWDFIDLNQFESRVISITVNNFPPPTNVIGDDANLTATVFPVATDTTPEDNTVAIKHTYVGSFDPNDKQGFPIGYEEEHYIQKDTEIEYLIRFQRSNLYQSFFLIIIMFFFNIYCYALQ